MSIIIIINVNIVELSVQQNPLLFYQKHVFSWLQIGIL